MSANEILFSACRYLKITHGRNESEAARRLLYACARFTDPFVGINPQGTVYAQTPCWSVLCSVRRAQ